MTESEDKATRKALEKLKSPIEPAPAPSSLAGSDARRDPKQVDRGKKTRLRKTSHTQITGPKPAVRPAQGEGTDDEDTDADQPDPEMVKRVNQLEELGGEQSDQDNVAAQIVLDRELSHLVESPDLAVTAAPELHGAYYLAGAVLTRGVGTLTEARVRELRELANALHRETLMLNEEYRLENWLRLYNLATYPRLGKVLRARRIEACDAMKNTCEAPSSCSATIRVNRGEDNTSGATLKQWLKDAC